VDGGCIGTNETAGNTPTYFSVGLDFLAVVLFRLPFAPQLEVKVSQLYNICALC